MRTGGGRAGARAALALCALLILTALAAPGIRAADSVLLPDGDLLTVWERRSPRMIVGSGGNEGQSIAYSVSGLEGSVTGTVGPTADLWRDSWPRLIVDPSSGWPVLFWSRHDGISLKIAYARYDSGGWTNIHFVTFGYGNHLVPRVGAGREGAYLFWVAYESTQYMYAPVDLGLGHLLASPHALPTFLFPEGPVPDYGGGADAVYDVPVVTGVSPEDSSGSQIGDDGGGAQGVLDVPVVTGTSASIWSASSDSACRSQILVLPSVGLSTATVVRFTHGSVTTLSRVSVPSPVPGGFGDSIGAGYLDATCD